MVSKIIYILVIFVSFVFIQKIPLVLSVFSGTTEHTEWSLHCSPNARWFGGSDGGFFLDIKHEKAPHYYVTAYNENGSLLFKGGVLFIGSRLDFSLISDIKNEYNESNIESWFIKMKDNSILSVVPQQEKEFLDGKDK
ncbi:hypothetical protein [Entomohabitans teleogrylli]|uniref:hypothetical protein n=1 Tax=Entomohabitans teleogrylli TaxID=1384589 RepID=UPI00073DA2DF|nr:hypothetical protein [Entomohabitans teleogrylli]